MQPLVTIAMPVRNGELFIRKAIESVLSQSYASLRLLISDNCSSDSTPQILEEYARRDSRVVNVRQEKDLGLIGNLYYCIQSAKTPYVAFLPHDDYYESSQALEQAVSVLEQSPQIAAVYSDMKYVGQKGETLATRRFKRSGIIDGEKLFRRSIITTRNMFGIPILMRHNLIKTIPFDERLKYVADVEFSYLGALGHKVYHIPQCLIANRYHSYNATRGLINQAQEQFMILRAKHNVTLSVSEHLENLIYAPLVRRQKQLFFLWLRIRTKLGFS